MILIDIRNAFPLILLFEDDGESLGMTITTRMLLPTAFYSC